LNKHSFNSIYIHIYTFKFETLFSNSKLLWSLQNLLMCVVALSILFLMYGFSLLFNPFSPSILLYYMDANSNPTFPYYSHDWPITHLNLNSWRISFFHLKPDQPCFCSNILVVLILHSKESILLIILICMWSKIWTYNLFHLSA